MELHTQIVIEAPAASAWAVLGQGFGEIGEWAAPIASSTLDGELGVGAVRTCSVAGFGPVAPGIVHERLTTFEPERMTLEYEAVGGLPSFMARAVNRLSVAALGERRCQVRSDAMVTLRGPLRLASALFKWQIQLNARRVLQELRHQVEHGRAHPRKARSVTVSVG
jgi:Polyketide cyclase / dehydrase and lipid transport